MNEMKGKARDPKITAELNKNYDVIIVGSGPAGASVAKTLSGSGLNVVIIEKCTLPRDKMCSGIILPSAREFLAENYDVIPEHVYTEPREVKGSRYVCTTDNQSQVKSFPALDLAESLPSSEYGLNVYRSEFDLWLCKESDAPLVDDCLLVDYKLDGRDINVQVKHAGQYLTIKTRYLIGADGPISRVRRSLAPEFDKTLGWVALYEEHYEGEFNLEPGWMYWVLDPNSFGSILHKGSRIHITAATAGEETAKYLLEKYVKFLTAQHGLKINKTAAKRGIVSNNMPFTENYLLGNGNVLLVGEAAGFIRALDGITSALVTGKAAGESVLKSIQSGKTALEYYSEHGLIHSEREACQKSHPTLGEKGFVFA